MMVTIEKNNDDFLLEETTFLPENIELNGSKFLLGNGYMGYRGTMEEYTKEDQVACTLAGVYDRMGDAWREPVNAPNGLHTVLYCEQQPLTIKKVSPEKHRQSLDLYRAVHQRETLFNITGNKIRVAAERFLSLDDVRLMVMKYRFQAEKPGQIIIQTGIDADVRDINGPHLKEIRLDQGDGQLSAVSTTNEGVVVAVAEMLEFSDGVTEIVAAEKTIYRRITVNAEAGREYFFHKYVSVYTSKDGVKEPLTSAKTTNTNAINTGYEKLYLRHTQLWHERWLKSDVIINGDPEAQLAIRYSIYQLLAAAPEHSEKISIPARSLSGQTYKGAVFWDTELFMLPFFNYTHPDLARNIIKYRCHTLDGARRKATEYGYRGAFYAWESQETGDDACTHFNVTDVYSGRPMRTYFRDKQIHISADVVYGLWQYYLVTGDESIFFEGGAEVVLECARFFCSYAYFKKDKNRYEILDVTGPDEYHERVSNNAFTNLMVKHTLENALWLLKFLRKKDLRFYQSLIAKLNFEPEIPLIREMHELLYIPVPQAESLLIEQFDGYGRLEDLSLEDLKARIKIPNEYLGGGNGLATTTKILKQADVVTLLSIFKSNYSQEVKKANWEYYEPRTEHGSSLSHCIYAMVAADIGKPDWAYPYFLKTATIDLSGAYKRYVGDLYIGGTHPAANGGAWMAVVFGFGGLSFDGETIKLQPALPDHWNSLIFQIRVHNQAFKVEIGKTGVKIRAALENTSLGRFNIAGKLMDSRAGEEMTSSVE